MDVAVLVGPGVSTREALAPTQVLECALGVRARYVGEAEGPVNGHDPSHRFEVESHYSMRRPDVLLIPGGFGALEATEDTFLVEWLDCLIRGGGAVLAVSTGSLLVCATGLFEGRAVAGHWLCASHIRALGCSPSPYPMETHGRVVTTSGTAAALGGAAFVADVARWGPLTEG